MLKGKKAILPERSRKSRIGEVKDRKAAAAIRRCGSFPIKRI